MPTIYISNKTYTIIASLAKGQFQSTGKQDEKGWWHVPVDQDVYDFIMPFKGPDESVDKCLLDIFKSPSRIKQ